MNKTNTYIRLEGKEKNNFPSIIIVHHSGGTDKYPLMDTSNHTAKDMESWHLSLGWEGLGYHYVIHKNGDVWFGRPEHRNGAHCIGHNTDSIGICLSGNFDLTLPTKEQESSLRKLLISLMERYNITKDKIVPHRKYANKTCYGKNLKDDWASNLTVVNTEEFIKIPKKLADELKKFL
jgi:N-acetylmuramoyl-L-alanine amidase